MGLIDQHRLKGQRLLQGHVLPVHLDGSDQLAAFRHLWKPSAAAEEGVPQWLPAGAAGVPQHVPGGLCGGIRAVLHRLSHGADQGSPADSHLWVLLDFPIPKWRINLWNSHRLQWLSLWPEKDRLWHVQKDTQDWWHLGALSRPFAHDVPVS